MTKRRPGETLVVQAFRSAGRPKNSPPVFYPHRQVFPKFGEFACNTAKTAAKRQKPQLIPKHFNDTIWGNPKLIMRRYEYGG